MAFRGGLRAGSATSLRTKNKGGVGIRVIESRIKEGVAEIASDTIKTSPRNEEEHLAGEDRREGGRGGDPLIYGVDLYGGAKIIP